MERLAVDILEVDWVVVVRSELVGLAGLMAAWLESDSRRCKRHGQMVGLVVGVDLRRAVAKLVQAKAVAAMAEGTAAAEAVGDPVAEAAAWEAAEAAGLRRCRTCRKMGYSISPAASERLQN